MLELNANPNCSRTGTPLLIQAIIDSKWQFFQAIMESEQSLSLDCIDKFGDTPLLKTCIYPDKSDYRKELLARKAAINDEDIKKILVRCKGSPWITNEEKLTISAQLLEIQQKNRHFKANNRLKLSA